MKIQIADVPTEHDALAAWLERQLVGLDLGDLVLELSAFQNHPGPAADLADLLGSRRQDVLKTGLQVLSLQQLRGLLQSPAALLELQELACLNGGAYWQGVEHSAEHAALVEAGWQWLSTTLNASAMPARSSEPTRSARSWFRNARRMLTAVAVMLMVSLGIWLQWRPAPRGWGFDQPGALQVQLSAPRYLEHLATQAAVWFKQRPATKPALEQRLREFRHGCDTLIDAPHSQLAAADRAWLVERCRVWSAKLDGHLADLSGGEKSVEQVRAESDATINTLIQALRDRGQQVS